MNKKHPIDTRFGTWLRKRRRSLDITLGELAKATGLDAPRLSRIEHGLQRPPMPNLAPLFAKVLKIKENSPEYEEMVGYLVDDRLRLISASRELKRWVTVKIHGVLNPVQEEKSPPSFVRVKENPRRIYDLEAAAQRALQNIALEKASVVSARLLVRDTKGQEWEYDVMLSRGRKGVTRSGKFEARKFPSSGKGKPRTTHQT